MKQPTCLDPSSTNAENSPIKILPPLMPDSCTTESTPGTASKPNPAQEGQKRSPQPLSDQETENASSDAG